MRERRCRFETLENKRLLAILWENQGTADFFEEEFGEANAPLARTIVNCAIADWEAVISDFNYDGDENPNTVDSHNNTLTLNISAADIEAGNRGVTRAASLVYFNGRITNASIELDVNADGDGWFFDPTPEDDAEFTSIVNSGPSGTRPAFYSSFIDTAQAGIRDFYDTILHEIGHAVGIVSSQLSWLGFGLSLSFTDDPLSSDPNHVLRTYSGTTVSATFTTAGGLHLYEATAANPVHPNELMNSGRTLTFDSSTLIPTVRRQISNLAVRVLADAYGYGVTLPSTLNTAHVTLDSQTGTLLVHGGVTTQNFGQHDEITIDTVDEGGVTMVRVQVDDTSNNRPTTEKVRLDQVSQIVIAKYGGQDDIEVAPALAPLVKEVFFAVSTNQDSANTGADPDDYIVDVDPAVPGTQIPIRAAIVETNNIVANPPVGIYVPRGHYGLAVAGTGGTNQGDLDITENIVIIGTGAGATIIDGSSLVTTTDRIFDIASGGSLDLSHVTLTGGKARAVAGENGGAIAVRNSGTFNLSHSALVGNETTMGAGGAIYFYPTGAGTIANSVITGNFASSFGGGIFLGNSPPASPPATVTMTNTIVANNTAGGSPRKTARAVPTWRPTATMMATWIRTIALFGRPTSAPA